MHIIMFILLLVSIRLQSADHPNILWITSEDNGHYLGCYGDPVARTPNLDELAKRSTRYLNCFSNAAVCAPARQTLISGMYATSLGGQHMRSKAVFPPGVHYFPKYLRDLGYHTSNNSKTDYNGGPADSRQAMAAAWNESGRNAHWRNRSPGQPFFAVFNIGDSHESNLFPNKWKKRELKTDPATVKLPAYLPDLPETRRDMARYYDCIETMDSKVGKILAALDADGLTEEAIIFYFGDHGGSLPRGKSYTYDSGTRVPLIIHIPNKWKHLRPTEPGEATDRLVSFVDFAATILSLAGIKPPAYMQGKPFLGEHVTEPRRYVHTFRGRRGERYDLVRGVRTKEFLYLRNYTPHLPVMQFNGYSFDIPGYPAWMNAWQDGRCTPQQSLWFEPKMAEELYAVMNDPDNVTNLANQPAHARHLQSLREENRHHLHRIRDSIFLPEGMTGRNHTAYQDESRYPLKRLLTLAEKASSQNREHLPDYINAIHDSNAAIRHWGIMGCIMLDDQAQTAAVHLTKLLDDPEPLLQVQAARALAGVGNHLAAIPILKQHLQSRDQIIQLRAALAIDECDLIARDKSLAPLLKKLRGQYSKRVAQHILRTTD